MGTRGYHSYRGRGSTGKKVLAIVLGVILVAAGAFLLLQNRYVVYDENGNAHWELPFGKNKDDGRHSDAGRRRHRARGAAAPGS